MKKLAVSLTVLLILLTCSSVMAHRVDLLTYVEEGTVYTESYFPDGTQLGDGKIEVYDSSGKKLLDGKTDSNGLFSFTPAKKDDLKIVLKDKVGHKTSYFLMKEELEAGIKKEAAQKSAHAQGANHDHGPGTHVHTEEKHGHDHESEHAAHKHEHDEQSHKHKPRAKKESFPIGSALIGIGLIAGLAFILMKTSKKG